MCTAPNMISDGSLVACRKCEQCKDHRVDDWVGRCIAESKTCVAATSVTLTYGRDKFGNESHARAAILSYSDVQKYFKQLRRRGYPCRYLITGEMGSKKGRAHWHGIIFWLKKVPEIQTDHGNNAWSRWKELDQPVERAIRWNKRFHDPCWPHGFSHWVPVQKGRAKGSIRYVCKYIHKDLDDPTAQSKLAMSKLPPIGSAYFEQRAQRFVDEGISPQDRFYLFPDDARQIKTGKPIRFRLSGKSADLFCQHFIEKWEAQRPGTFWPHSDWIDEYQDKQTRDEWDRAAVFSPALQGHNDEGASIWRNMGVIEGIEIRKLQYENRLRTPSQWVDDLAGQAVYWITASTNLAGRWTLAKTQPLDGKSVWLRSLME
jgi:hypothetical protein